MISTEKKEILLPEEIIETKNWIPNLKIDPKVLSPFVEDAYNYPLFNNNKDVYIKLKTSKPKNFFTKAFVVIDLGCDLLNESLEVAVFYGDTPVLKNVFLVKKNVVSRYKFEFNTNQKEFKSENFFVVLRFLPSKNQNTNNCVFTLFSIFVETVPAVSNTSGSSNSSTEKFPENCFLTSDGRKFYIRNFCWKQNKDSIILSSKSKIVICTNIDVRDLIRNRSSSTIKLNVSFSVTRLLLTDTTQVNFSVDVGITTESLFKNADCYSEIEKIKLRSFDFSLKTYSERYNAGFDLKISPDLIEKKDLLLFFSFRDTENTDEIHISNLSFTTENLF